MGKLEHRLEQLNGFKPPEAIVAENSQKLVDNSAQVLEAIAAIPKTDLSELLSLLTALQNKEVDLTSLSRQIKAIPKTDLKPVIRAVSDIQQADITPIMNVVTTLKNKVASIERELKAVKDKKREFTFNVERETFSDLIKKIKVTEQ